MSAGLILGLVTIPAWPLVWQAIVSGEATPLAGSFAIALRNSLEIAALVGMIALVVGLPAGAVLALYKFPGRSLAFPIVMLPLLVPSFLWAIGWSALAIHGGPAATAWIAGRTGCVLVFLGSAIPLVVLVSYAATLGLSGTQIEAARLAGGERTVVCYACRYGATVACFAAALASVLTLSDPGPGQILGHRTAASDVLTSFSSQYDFGQAGRQCEILALAVLLVAIPLALLAASRLSSQILVRQVRRIVRISPRRLGRWIGLAIVALILVTIAAPLAGLLLPLGKGLDMARAWREVARTGFNSLVYAAGAGLVATGLGFLTAISVGRSDRLRTAVLGCCLALFALPPSMIALGMLYAATSGPSWLDWLTRGRAIVCLGLGLHFFPLATVIALRSWGTLPATWTHAAALHGIPLSKYFFKVVLPHLLPAMSATLLLVGLLATADVGTVLLLHPPGEASLPLAIFTVMANAPESLVASLCVSYLLLAFGLLLAFWYLAGKRNA
ncbi:MAG: ABC transporter permease [Hyphomicrobiaceae bacterium]